MLRILSVSLLALVVSGPLASAAVLENRDADAVRVTVSENGVRTEVEIAAGTTTTVCEDGCFVTFPDGDMLPLTGAETVAIENGKGRIAD